MMDVKLKPRFAVLSRFECQDKAKVWADANIVKLVFITNETETEKHMMSNGDTWSRMATPIIVDDLHRQEALAFLKAPYLTEDDLQAAETDSDPRIRRSASPRTGKTMDSELAERIVDLVGGRILQLIAMKRDWLYGVSFDDSAEELKSGEHEKLLQVLALRCFVLYSLFATRDHGGKRKETVWRPSVCPSVCLSRRHSP